MVSSVEKPSVSENPESHIESQPTVKLHMKSFDLWDWNVDRQGEDTIEPRDLYPSFRSYTPSRLGCMNCQDFQSIEGSKNSALIYTPDNASSYRPTHDEDRQHQWAAQLSRLHYSARIIWLSTSPSGYSQRRKRTNHVDRWRPGEN
jgi:hypothetical protein